MSETFATMTEAQLRRTELVRRKSAAEADLANKDLHSELQARLGGAGFKAWRAQQVAAIKEMQAQIAEAGQAIKEQRRTESSAMARVHGLDFDSTDPVMMVAALQAVVLDLVRASGLHMGSADDKTRSVMRLADDFRAQGEIRAVPWNEHLRAMRQAEQRHKEDLARLEEQLQIERAAVALKNEQLISAQAHLDRERLAWQATFAGEERSPAPVVIQRLPADYEAMKEQLQAQRRQIGALQAVVRQVKQAAQSVTDYSLRARGINSQVLITPDIQEAIDRVTR